MDNSELLQKLWECAKGKLTTDELNNNLLSAKDDRECTAWHVAAMIFNTRSLEEIWKWGKKNLTP